MLRFSSPEGRRICFTSSTIARERDLGRVLDTSRPARSQPAGRGRLPTPCPGLLTGSRLEVITETFETASFYARRCGASSTCFTWPPCPRQRPPSRTRVISTPSTSRGPSICSTVPSPREYGGWSSGRARRSTGRRARCRWARTRCWRPIRCSPPRKSRRRLRRAFYARHQLDTVSFASSVFTGRGRGLRAAPSCRHHRGLRQRRPFTDLDDAARTTYLRERCGGRDPRRRPGAQGAGRVINVGSVR